MAEKVSTQDISEKIDPDCFTLCSIRLENSKLKLEIGQTKTVKLTAMGMRNKPFKGQLEVKADVSDRYEKNFTKCDVAVQQNGLHRISYTPMRRGDKLHITANGNPIPGSPFKITVLPTPQCFQQPKRVIPGFHRPQGVAVNSKGQIIVVDANGTSVFILSPDGEKIRSFGSRGSGDGQFSYAFGVTVDKEDNIYVMDNRNQRVQKFNSEGEFIKKAGSAGNGNLQFYHAIGITYNHNDNLLYVAGNETHRIQVLTTDLAFVRAFGQYGHGDEYFDKPMNIAFDSANNIYVTECGNKQIKVLTTTGIFLRSFTLNYNGQSFNELWCIAIDSSNTVYVGEKGSSYLSVFTSQGDYITSVKIRGPKCFGLGMDNNDTLIVSDHDGGCLLLY